MVLHFEQQIRYSYCTYSLLGSVIDAHRRMTNCWSRVHKDESYWIKTKKQINGKEIIYGFVIVVFVSENECMQISHRKIKKL